MAKTQFDRLVESLSSEERREMLRKIEETFPLSSEPMTEEESRDITTDVDPIEYYYQADFITRFIVFLISLFTGKDKGEVILETFLARSRKKLNREYGLYFNLDKKQGYKALYNLLVNLDKSIAPFREALLSSMESKIDFYIFLTNRVMGKKEEEILNETDPLYIEQNFPDYSVSQIHKAIDDNYERILNSLDEEKQQQLTHYSTIFRQLHSLAIYDFNRLISSFKATNGEIEYCDLDKIKKSLMALNNILSSFRQPPDMILLQSIYLFYHNREISDGDDDQWEVNLQREIGSSVEGLNGIRIFNKKIPLTAVLRVLNGDINYEPDTIGGGEGALRHYKAYLKKNISERFKKYVNDKKKRDVLKSLTANWGVRLIEPIMGYQGKKFAPELVFTYESSLSALDVFLKKVIQGKYHQSLSLIQVNGDFYRRDNREEFTDTYEKLLRLPSQIRNFSSKYLTDGVFYRQINEALKDKETRQGREELYGALQIGDQEASILLNRSLEVLSSLSSLLKGIIMGTGGAYDTLSNYSDLGGSRNRDFKNELISLEFLVSNFNKSLLDIVSYEEKGSIPN